MQSTRIAALDHTKGLLVLLMVAYHVMSIATTAERDDFAWLRFVSNAFIGLTGWLIATRAQSDSNVGINIRTDALKANLALMRRGGKVLLLFLALNAAILATGWGNPHKALGQAMPLAERFWVVMTQAPSHLASFLILLPIGYLLVSAPLALRLNAQLAWATPLSLMAALVVATVPVVTDASAALSFWLVGWMGLAAGLLWHRITGHRAVTAQRAGTPSFETNALQPNLAKTLTSAVALMLMLALGAHWQSSVAAQALAVGGVLWAMVALVRAWPVPSWVAKSLSLLGRYSLLAYVAQIVLIQVAFRLMGAQRVALGVQALLMMLGTAACVLGICWVTERMRQRSVTADRSYRTIFA
jgi:hypothetical protein